jgi:hypothetical protein
VAVTSVPEEDDIVGNRGAVDETVVGNCDGWWCMGPVMSGTWMGDKSCYGGEELGMEWGVLGEGEVWKNGFIKDHMTG